MKEKYMNIFNKVKKFNKIILKINKQELGIPLEEEVNFSINHLAEELEEMILSVNKNDFLDYIDSILDMIYILIGMLYKAGLSNNKFIRAFNIVHQCNMKRVYTSNDRNGNSIPDAIKPKDWEDPKYKLKKLFK
jgi:predicted HAD superfamily Cof-like phosphohydrolase